MATRKYFIGGDSTADAAITVSVNNVQVYSGPVQPGNPALSYLDDDPGVFTWSKDSGPRLAVIEFETPDLTATTVSMSIRCDAGDIAIGDIMPVGFIRANPALTAEERAYLGDIDENTIPQAIKDRVAAKGGWRTYDPDLMYFPSPYQDIRTEVRNNGMAPSTDPEVMPRCSVDASAGEVVTMTLTLPSQPTVDRFTQADQIAAVQAFVAGLGISNFATLDKLDEDLRPIPIG